MPRRLTPFKIMVVDKNTKKGCLMSTEEYACKLKVLLGKSSQQSTITYDDFRKVIAHFH